LKHSISTDGKERIGDIRHWLDDDLLQTICGCSHCQICTAAFCV